MACPFVPVAIEEPAVRLPDMAKVEVQAEVGVAFCQSIFGRSLSLQEPGTQLQGSL